MADQGLQVEQYEIRNLNRDQIRGSRFRLAVVDVNGDLPREVFLYQRLPANETTGEVIDEFIGVASPTDLQLYPVDDPDPQQANAYLRRSYVELDFQSHEHHVIVLAMLMEQLATLTEAYKRAELYSSPQQSECGSGNSSSSSSG